VADGTFRATGSLQRTGQRWDLQLTIQHDGGQAKQILAGLYQGRGEVTGTLSLGGSLTSGGEGTAGFWQNLGGTLKLAMRDGRIGRYTVVAKILSIMNLIHLLGEGPDLATRGMPYSSIRGDIKITQGVAWTENLILESPAMRMTAIGSVNFGEDTMDMTVAAQPFQNLDWFITRIPVAGWILGGKEKSLIVGYFRVTGPLNEPQVSAVPWRSIGRNVFGIVRNLLGIPEALLDAFEDLPPQEVKREGARER
jgi:hypothetical protein